MRQCGWPDWPEDEFKNGLIGLEFSEACGVFKLISTAGCTRDAQGLPKQQQSFFQSLSWCSPVRQCLHEHEVHGRKVHPEVEDRPMTMRGDMVERRLVQGISLKPKGSKRQAYSPKSLWTLGEDCMLKTNSSNCPGKAGFKWNQSSIRSTTKEKILHRLGSSGRFTPEG